MDDFYVANPIGSFLYMQKYSRGRQSASFMMAHVAQEGLNQGPKPLCQGKGWPERGGNNVIFLKRNPAFLIFFQEKLGISKFHSNKKMLNFISDIIIGELKMRRSEGKRKSLTTSSGFNHG